MRFAHVRSLHPGARLCRVDVDPAEPRVGQGLAGVSTLRPLISSPETGRSQSATTESSSVTESCPSPQAAPSIWSLGIALPCETEACFKIAGAGPRHVENIISRESRATCIDRRQPR